MRSTSVFPKCDIWLICVLTVLSAGSSRGDDGTVKPASRSRLELRPVRAEGVAADWLQGTLRVFENRKESRGRMIPLYVVVLPGGPGAAATSLASSLSGSWIREDRDIVLVDQRGTGRSNPLRVSLPGSDHDLQGYLDPIFSVEAFRKAKARLEQSADLRMYTTPIAMDDLDEVRAALGYGKINLVGGSYGTRAALIYMRRHEQHVRTATLSGVAPVSFINPLYHAAAAQEGLNQIFAEIAAGRAKSRAFPDLKKQFEEVLARLEEEPAKVTIKHPRREENVTVMLSRDAFCEALRVMMYKMHTNRQVPMLIQQAAEGDYAPFVLTGIESNRRIRGMLAMGMLMSVVGSEDIPRITKEAIRRETMGTFLGDGRVRRQMAVSKIWPRGDIPASYADPVRAKTPTLLTSGTHDPVTPPRWGATAARHLANSLHLIVPAVHGSFGAPVEKVKCEFLRTGKVDGLDTTSVKQTRLPPFSVRAKGA